MAEPGTVPGDSPSRPPGPDTGLFGFRNVIHAQKDLIGFLTDTAREYGELSYFRLGPFKVYLVNSPELIRDLLVTDTPVVRKLPAQTRVLAQIEGKGMLVTEGEHWKKHRRLIAPAFRRKAMGHYADLTVDITLREAEGWTDGQIYDVSKGMTNLAFLIMARSFFGADMRDEVDQWRKTVRVLSSNFLREIQRMVLRPRWWPLRSVREKYTAIDSLDERVYQLLREAINAEKEGDDALSVLTQAVRSGKISETQARDELVTLFNSGHDTTAAALVWLWHLIASHPEVEAKLIDEVDGVLGGRPPTVQDYDALVYTQQVVNETLRLYPPGWSLFTRQLTESATLFDYPVEKGDWIMIVPFVTHRDANYFPDPLVFDPDRFSPANRDRMVPYSFIPFGAGPHQCIGNYLSVMQITLIAATVLQRYRLRKIEGEPEPEIDVLLSIWPRERLKLRLEKRQDGRLDP